VRRLLVVPVAFPLRRHALPFDEHILANVDGLVARLVVVGDIYRGIGHCPVVGPRRRKKVSRIEST